MITPAERHAMIARLNETRELVHRTVEGLSPAQLVYRPEPGRWSVAENLEHMAVVEQRVLAGLMRTLQQPTDPTRKSALTDEQVLSNVGVVRQKLSAPEALLPKSRWPLESLLSEFDSARQRTVEFATSTADSTELRHYFMPHPAFGDLDCYQWFMLAAGHSERHCIQCDGVKASANYPR